MSINSPDQPEKAQKSVMVPQGWSQNKANQAKYRNMGKKAKSGKIKKEKKKKVQRKKRVRKDNNLAIRNNAKPSIELRKKLKNLPKIFASAIIIRTIIEKIVLS